MRSKQIIHSEQSKNFQLIPLDLIKAKQFKKNIDLVNQKLLLTHRDRYLYGYSLFYTKQYLNALLTLWPLVTKGYSQLEEDCKSIVAHIFQDLNFLSKEQGLSEKNLYSLFVIVQNLMPQSSICTTLQKQLFDILWQKRDYEQLERNLKSSKKNCQEFCWKI